METVRRCLKEGGLSTLHTIGNAESTPVTDPWIEKYIFPNGLIPSSRQITQAAEDLFVIEDWHNFGPDYDQTLMAWADNFESSWDALSGRYSDRFYRMWRYYLYQCAGAFRARRNQLWQIVLSPEGVGSVRKRPVGDLLAGMCGTRAIPENPGRPVSLDSLEPGVGVERLRELDTAVRLLVVLEERRHDAGKGQAAPVERVNELGLSLGLWPVPDLHPARLEIFEVRDRRNLQPPVLRRAPHLEVVLLGLRKAHVSRAHEKPAVRKFECVEGTLCVGEERVEGPVALVGMDDAHELHLVELV